MISRRLLTIYILPLVSLLLAVLLWYYVVGQKEREWTFNVPVFVLVASPDVAGWSTPEKVSVVLRGPQRIIDQMEAEKLLVRLVLAENQPGEFTRSIGPSMVAGLPSGVEIIRIEPSEVRIEIRPLVEIRYKISPNLRPAADGAFRIREVIDIEPRFAELRGTRNALRDLADVATEPITAAGPPGRRSVEVRLIAPPGTRIHPQTATVTYLVEATAETEAPE